MNVLIFGPPGSGKSTHSRTITERYGLTYVSSGDMIRAEIERGSPLGREMERYLARGGELIPRHRRQHPRDIEAQARQEELHHRRLSEDGGAGSRARELPLRPRNEDRPRHGDIHLEGGEHREDLRQEDLPPQLRRGLSHQVQPPPKVPPGKCDICGADLIQREDDRPEIVERRYDLYTKNMEPIIKFYRKQGLYVRVDGHGSISEVWERIRPPLLDYIKNRESRSSGGET